MVFIVPDILLENQCCSSCKKYLSVGPVKVYSDGTTKCGRCSEENDGGAPSMYNKLVNEGLFRCIDRYEGCNEILSSSDMKEHEAQHATYFYYCYDCEFKGTAYMMRKHYKESHNNYILTRSELEIDLTGNDDHTYLYREKDFIFFVYINNGSELILDIECLRRTYVNVKYTLKIVSSNNYYQLYEKQHCAENAVGPIILGDAHSKCILKFELELPESVLSLDQINRFLSKKDLACVVTMAIEKLSTVYTKGHLRMSSSVFLSYGLKFKLYAGIEYNPACGLNYLNLFLISSPNETNTEFSGRFHILFSLLSVKPEINNFRKEVYYTAHNQTIGRIAVRDFKPIHEILDPANGFIKTDEINVKVEIKVLYLSYASDAISTQ